MPELRALPREHRLRNYSRLRITELIAFLHDNEPQAPRRQRPPRPNRPPSPPPQMPAWKLQREPQTKVTQPELEAPLTKRQLKHRWARDSKLAKKFVRDQHPEILHGSFER